MSVDNAAREQLRAVVGELGRSAGADPRLCEALLRDYCGDRFKREVSLLVAAAKDGGAAELAATTGGVPLSVLITRLARRLHDNLGIEEDLARWSIESWAVALGLLAEQETTPLPPPAARISTPAHTAVAGAFPATGLAPDAAAPAPLPVVPVVVTPGGDLRRRQLVIAFLVLLSFVTLLLGALALSRVPGPPVPGPQPAPAPVTTALEPILPAPPPDNKPPAAPDSGTPPSHPVTPPSTPPLPHPDTRDHEGDGPPKRRHPTAPDVRAQPEADHGSPAEPAASDPTPKIPPPVIESFEVESVHIEPRCARLILRWTVHGATSIAIEPEIGYVQSSSGYRRVPPKPERYTMTVKGPGGTADKSVTLSEDITRGVCPD